MSSISTASAQAPSNGKASPTRILPTDRIAVAKQFDSLRAYAAVSGPENKAVTNEGIASIVKMHRGTISYMNPFFVEVGFLQRVDSGFLPSPEVVSFNRAYEWNPETAAYKLASLLERTWFAEALFPKLRFGQLSEKEAIDCLGEACAATKERKSQLEVILAYLHTAGLIVRENGSIRLSRENGAGTTEPEKGGTTERSAMPTDDAPRPARPANVNTSFSAAPTEGVIQFHVSVRVDMSEFKGWKEERIAAFFAGIAQVLAAKGRVEESANPS